ncbi:MAG TPA: glycogen/starch/alpha-glucan phosphorylase [Myxococcota bacterium]|nr:glycogen/starch/alpha-glucan phosphorylase [Myxococcota bacterium]
MAVAPLNDDDPRTGLGRAALGRGFFDHLTYTVARVWESASPHDLYLAAAYTARDRILANWARTIDAMLEHPGRKVAFLSAEYLLGPHLGHALVNLGILERVAEMLKERGYELEALLDIEQEPGLGNGGLGRLAACYLDSLATLRVPAFGYGIRYEFGIFDQRIRDGRQIEITDKWLRYGNPWEIPRLETAYDVGFGGRVEHVTDAQGQPRARWVRARVVKGVPYDTPIQGYRVPHANTLRLWKAGAAESFDFGAFNVGDYYGAVDQKVVSENLTKVLYPNDASMEGKQLRLEQQYFLVSCSLQDMISLHLAVGRPIDGLHEHVAVQLNDTHPSLAVPELMRLLVDQHGLEWERAWNVTRHTFGYTNHTLLPEALETWPLDLFGRVLPRHLEIVYEINRRFLDEVRALRPGDEARVRRMSLFDENDGRRLRMAHLATVGSHTVNGVAELHSELLRTRLLHDFAEIWPEKFTNVTNGVTPRRFLVLANPELTRIACSRIGEDWVRELEQLQRLEPFAEEAGFRAEWRAMKLFCKQRLAKRIERYTGVEVDPSWMFDVHVKRIHEYKRQHLNALHVVTLYHRLKHDLRAIQNPRVVLFGGKAAPGYAMAKLVIELILGVADVVNHDPAVRDHLRVVFFPDLNVKHGQVIYPAADVSEQISLAGTEASGTGNMKLTLNGALTIGTLDGANVEIQAAVGAENFFQFGLTADEVALRRARGYRPRDVYEADPELRAALDAIAEGAFSRGDRERFAPLVRALLDRDEYLALADYRAYVDRQVDVDRAFSDSEAWTRASILNTARAGRFSSDRAVREYCERIWRVEPMPA